MAKVICITNQKGRCWKNDDVGEFGVLLAKDRNKVLLVDMDPQGNASSGLGVG